MPVSAATRKKLILATTPFAVATLIGIALLWPSGRGLPSSATGPPQVQYGGIVVGVERAPCNQPGQENFDCAVAEIRLEEGPDKGDAVSLNIAEGPNARHIQPGDKVRLAPAVEGASGQAYYFVDFQRSQPLLILGLIFAGVVIALSRWRGVTSLIGLAASMMILVTFVLPAILEGSSPLAVAVFGGAAIMFITLYLAHGFNAMTTTAVLGTLTSLTITGVLALVFVEAVKFTGFGSEEAVFLQMAAQQVNLQGLLLGGIVIGTLGVLDDVTVTQASAVWELHRTNPTLGSLGLYRAGVRIGRDHIASTVNTLVLAYAGASLPLLILFSLADTPFAQIVTSEIVAEEIVRTLVGSIGLVAAVPLTTGLAALVAGGDSGPRLLGRRRPEPEPPSESPEVPEETPEIEIKRPKAEEFFRE